MTIRTPTTVGWYPDDRARCGATIDRFVDSLAHELPGALRGGVVPHAGWAYSGSTAALTFAALAHTAAPRVVVVLGAVHAHGVDGPTACDHEAWQTPMGLLEVDAPLRSALAERDLVGVDGRAHAREHSIEVQAPLLAHLLPSASFLPVAVPPSPSAADFGRQLAAVLEEDGRPIAVVASTDLTHYGEPYGFAPGGGGQPGMDWARANDDALLERIRQMDAEGVLEHARQNRSACGAGAVAAAIACMNVRGATGATVLGRTSSYEQMPDRGEALWVGYASVVFTT